MSAFLDTGWLDRTTREMFIPVLKINMYNKPRGFKLLVQNGRKKAWHGTALNWTVIPKKQASVGMWGGYSTQANQPINPGVAATLANSNYYATVAISLEEEMKNSGVQNQEKLLNILTSQMKNAESTLVDLVATHFYADGTAVGQFQPLIGLGAIVDTDNTYAGINRSTTGNENWQSNVNASVYTDENLQDPTHAGYMPNVMMNSFTSATHDEAPNVIFTTKRLYNIYQTIAQTRNLRFGNDTANLGFKGVEFQGVTMYFDDYCTAKALYMLNTNDFQLYVFDGADFDLRKGEQGQTWFQPIDQFAKVAHILFMGQLRCDAPRQQAVASALGDS